MFSWIFALSLQATYATLDPSSISQHLAFYELYSDTKEGKEALRHAWELLSSGCTEQSCGFHLPELDLSPMISLVNRSKEGALQPLSESQLEMIEKISQHLPNRKLKGYGIWDVAKLKGLLSQEIDLARALFLFDMEKDPLLLRTYEAMIDLMSLQIQARLPLGATSLEKVRAINDYIFGEMRFRYPPHSLWAKDIDPFTQLPDVLDSRRGVCLGVSVLYLTLAQRLDLPLQIVTPPGHIFVRYVSPEGEITNIETTARGIDTPTEVYLSLETKSLEQRTLKETIGMVFMNQAAVAWHNSDFKQAIALYEKARPFLENDYLLQMFLGYNYLFDGRIAEGKALLEKIRNQQPAYAISQETVIDDYLAGKADIEALKEIFLSVDETRESILEKQKTLAKTIERCPSFRQGIFHYAMTYLQLGREKEAIPLLERYATLDPSDPVVHYYLAAIHHKRLNFNPAWHYLRKAEKLVFAKDHHPRALKDLRQVLQRSCPE